MVYLKNKSALKADPLRILVINILFAASYLLLGKISYYFAIPPGLITVIWPLSGISGAAVIWYGYRTLPGIFAGSFILNVNYFGSSAPHPHSIAAILLIAAGTALQSGLFGYYFKRIIGEFPLYPKPSDLGKFLLISSGASLISALTGGLSITYVNIAEWEAFLFTFITWWAGEFLGIIVFLPLIMSLAAVLTKKKSKQLILNIVGSLGILLNLMIFVLIYQGETRHINTLFSTESKTLSNSAAINCNSLDRDLMTLVSLSESAGFRSSAGSSFVPARFIAGIDHLFSNENIGFIQVKESVNPVYLPVFSKDSGVNKDLGSKFDLNSDTANSNLLRKAEKDDKTVLLTARLSDKGTKQRYIFILAHPVRMLHEKDLAVESGESRYFAAIFIRPERLFLRNHKEHSLGIEHFFYEKMNSDLKLIGASTQNQQPQDILNPEYIRINSSWHNKEWIIVNIMGSRFTAHNRSLIPWIVLFLGTIFIVLSIYYLYKRFLIMEVLTKNEKDYRLLAESVSDIIWVFDFNAQQFNYISPSVLNTRGFTSEEAMKSKLEDTLSPESFRRLTRLIPERLKEIDENPSISYTDEYEQRHKNGGYVPTEVTMKFRTNETNGHLEIFGVTRDISERKKSGEKLKLSEEKFNKAFKLSPIAIVLMSAETGQVLEVNDAYYNATGYTEAEVIGKTSPELKIFKSEEDRLTLLNTLMSAGKFSNREIDFVMKSGIIRNCLVSAELVNVADNKYFLVAIQDITDIRKANDQIRNQQALLSTILNATPDCVYVADKEFNLMLCNTAQLNRWGKTNENIIGMKLSQLLPAQAAEEDMKVLNKTIKENTSINGIYEYDDRYFYNTYIPLQEFNNEAFAVVKFSREVTEDIHRQEKIRRSEEQFRLISMAISDYLFSSRVDSDGSLHHEWVTGAFEEITGYPFPEYQAMGGWRAAVYPEDLGIEEENWSKLSRNERVNSELRTIKKGGDILWVRVSAIPIWDEPENRLAGIIGAVEDISDRKKIELELKKERETLSIRIDERTADLKTLNEELAKALKYKDEFLANMSHELRTPLNGILALSESLIEQVRGPLNEKQLKSVTTIQQSGKHLLDLINDILDLAKIESGKVELNYSILNVNELCESSLLFVKEISKKKNQKLAYNISVPALMINADGRRLKQILVNLLNNAVKFTPENGQIWLDAGPDTENSNIIFTIKDSGIGITKEDISKLFKPFVQLDSGLTRMHEGTGLGLALVHKLTYLHRGTISVRSEGEGKGSEFRVVIPINMKESGKKETADGLFDSNKLHKAMIVDDSPSTVQRLSEYLSRFGIESIANFTGEKSLEIIIENKPDIIFLDLLLPDISGFEILREIKANPMTLSIPVIIISSIDEREKGLQMGAAEYLVKPVSENDIIRLFSPGNGYVHEKDNSVNLRTPAEENKENERTGGNILLVEDNEINIYSMGEYLMEKGYTVTIARNGIDALKRLETVTPDLILMDIQMPVLDGIETTERIRQIPKFKDLPVFALTALAMTGDRERCMKAGVNEYISKPVELRQLKELIEKYLSNKK